MARTPEAAKRFAEALYEYMHRVGILRASLREVARLQQRFDAAAGAMTHAAVTGEKIAAVCGELPSLRDQVHAAHATVEATAIDPPHPVDGIDPRDWTSQLLRDLQASTRIVCGRGKGWEPTGLDEKEESELLTALRRLDAAMERIGTFRWGAAHPGHHSMLSPNEGAIWDALNGRAMSATELRAYGCGRSVEQVTNTIAAIRRKLGTATVQNARDGRGYWRPDAPPTGFVAVKKPKRIRPT